MDNCKSVNDVTMPTTRGRWVYLSHMYSIPKPSLSVPPPVSHREVEVSPNEDWALVYVSQSAHEVEEEVDVPSSVRLVVDAVE